MNSSRQAGTSTATSTPSILLHAYPDLVSDDFSGLDHEATERPHLLVMGVDAYTDTGVIGHPSLATATKGAAILSSLVASFDESHKLLLDAQS